MITASLIADTGEVNVTVFGDIAGTIQGQTGVTITAGADNHDPDGGTVSGSISAGDEDSGTDQIVISGTKDVDADITAYGEVSISVSTGGDFTGTINGGDGSVTVSAGGVSGGITSSGAVQVTAGRDISSAIQAFEISELVAGGDISGNVDVEIINQITAAGTISGNMTAAEDIGGTAWFGLFGITAGVDITGEITSSDGDIYLVEASRDMNGQISDVNGELHLAKGGRDVDGDGISADTIDAVTAGRDSDADVDATDSISAISAGRTIDGDITTVNGSIGSVAAGSGWSDSATTAGKISGSTIESGAGIGNVTVSAALNYDGAIINATITANDGNIGNITAVSGIQANATATDSIGNITTPRGDIAGSFTATHGNIGDVTATAGSLSASLTAGTDIGNIVVAKNISGNMTAGDDIGDINVLGSISGNISAGSTGGSVGSIFVGKNLSGNVSAGQNIGNVIAGVFGGSITGTITATHGSIGSILSFGDVQGPITSGAGSLSIVATGKIAGAITAKGAITAFAGGDLSGSLTTTFGQIYAYSLGDASGNINAPGDILAWSGSNITGSATSQAGSVIEKAKDNLPSTITAKTSVDAMSLDGHITGSTYTSDYGAKGFAGGGIQDAQIHFQPVSSGAPIPPTEKLSGESDGTVYFQGIGGPEGIGNYTGQLQLGANLSYVRVDDDKALEHLAATMDSQKGQFNAVLDSLGEDFADYLDEAKPGVRALVDPAAWSTLYTMQVDATSQRIAKVMIQNPDDSKLGSYLRGTVLFANDNTGGTKLGEWWYGVDIENARDLTRMESAQRLLSGGGQIILTTVGASESLFSAGKGYTNLGVADLKTWATTFDDNLDFTGSGIAPIKESPYLPLVNRVANTFGVKMTLGSTPPKHLDIGGEGAHPGATNLNPQGITSTQAGDPIPNWVKGYGENIPYPADSIPLVSVENAPITAQTAKEIARVIKPGGTIRLVNPVEYGTVAHARVIQAVGKGAVVTQSTENGMLTTTIRVP